MQLCARDRWKLRVFFGTEIFMGQEPHGSSQWPWICCSSSWGRMDPGHRSSEGAREELSHRGTLPAPDCGLRGLQKPPNAFPKAAGSHWGRYILGCSRGMGGFIQTIHRDQEPASASLPGWNLGFFFFTAVFSPPLSLSLLLAYFCLLQGLRSFPETAFPKEATFRWTVGGKVFASPRHRSSYTPRAAAAAAPSCSRFLEHAEEYSTRGGESSKNSLLQPPGAPLLPEGAMAKWVSPDLLQSHCAQWGHFSP